MLSISLFCTGSSSDPSGANAFHARGIYSNNITWEMRAVVAVRAYNSNERAISAYNSNERAISGGIRVHAGTWY
jgi:hypothetical protein